MTTHSHLPFQRGAFHSSRRRRGAALIEFALVAVIFLTMLLGMLQFGIYLNVTNTLWNLSREGARFAAVQKPGTADADLKIRNRIRDLLPPNINLEDMNIEILPTNAAARTGGTPVEVRLTYDMQKKFFVPAPGLASSYTTKTSMVVESN